MYTLNNAVNVGTDLCSKVRQLSSALLQTELKWLHTLGKIMGTFSHNFSQCTYIDNYNQWKIPIL